MDAWVKWFLDGVSVSAILGALMGMLPVVAAVVALAWYGIEIYESHTFQAFLAHRRERRSEKLKRRIAELQRQLGAHVAKTEPVKSTRQD